jgi:hypothetical protein
LRTELSENGKGIFHAPFHIGSQAFGEKDVRHPYADSFHVDTFE